MGELRSRFHRSYDAIRNEVGDGPIHIDSEQRLLMGTEDVVTLTAGPEEDEGQDRRVIHHLYATAAGSLVLTRLVLMPEGFDVQVYKGPEKDLDHAYIPNESRLIAVRSGLLAVEQALAAAQ